jgi:hypothetical protein
MDKITTTIKRGWLGEIAARRKMIEYREIKPYWIERLSGVKAPFLLRLINGMQANAPELTVVVERVRKNSRSGVFRTSSRKNQRSTQLGHQAQPALIKKP